MTGTRSTSRTLAWRTPGAVRRQAGAADGRWATRRCAWAAAVLLLLALPATGQQTFEETTSVLVVEVPVEVVDRQGTPIRGLTRDNFEIIDDRTKRPIVYFDVVDRAATATAEETPQTSAGRRHFLFLFDLSFSDPSSILRARDAAKSMLDDLHPTDLAAVATFTLLRGPELVLAFTPDRRQAELAMDTLGAPQLVDRTPDPLGLVLNASEEAARQSDQQGDSGGEGVGGRSLGDETMREYLRELAPVADRLDRNQQANRIQGMVRSMAGLAGLMRSVQGRKHVIYLSEGFDSRVLVGEGGDDEMNRSIESGETWNVDTDAMFGSGRVQNLLESMLEEFRRADCAIEAVDIGGLRAASAGVGTAAGQEGLTAMARGTGGQIYRNFSDLGDAMDQLLVRTSVTYVLGFQPEDLAADGSYRRLKVRLKDAPRGARIIHRPGYFAPRPDAAKSADEKRLELAGKLLSGTAESAIGVAVLAAPFRLDGQRPYVPVLVEIDGSDLLQGVAGDQAGVEIYAYALRADGSVGDFLNQSLGLDLRQVGDRLRQGGVKLYGELDLDPGEYNLRVLVRSPATGLSGTESFPLTVPDFAAGEAALLPPFAAEGDERWLMVRQAAAPGGRETPYPFTVDDGQMFVPSALPTLTSSRPLVIYGYNLGDGELALDAQILDAQGFVLLGQQLPIHRRTVTPSGATQVTTSLQLGGVPEGTYTLLVGARSAATGTRALSSATVHVPAGAGDQASGVAAPPAASAAPASGRNARRLEQLASQYRAALAKLSLGDRDGAARDLVAMETAERERTDDVLLKLLLLAELEVATELGEGDAEALIPVMLLHERAYLGYRDSTSRLLARHSRSVVRQLAEIYVQIGAPPGAHHTAAQVFTSLGGTLQQSGLTATANSLFERALDLEPENQAALLSLAVYHEKIGAYRQAAAYLKRLTTHHPEDSEGWLRLGLNLRRLGEEEEARRWLLRAIREEAEPWVRTLAYQELALERVRSGDLRRAEDLLREGLSELPGDQRLSLQLAHVLDRRGRKTEAVALLAEVESGLVAPGGSPRYRYNRWPIHVIEDTRRQLASTADERLTVLAKVINDLSAVSR